MIYSLSLESWLRSLKISKKINLTIILEKRVKKCWEETTQNKADKLQANPQRDNQSRRQEKIELSWSLHSGSYSVIDKQQIHK